LKINQFNFLSKKRIYLAICIGVIISGFLLYNEVVKTNFSGNLKNISITYYTFGFLMLSILFMLGRDFGYVLRLKLLTHQKLSWKQAIKVILIWEFTSAVSPGVVGGSAVAMFILKKEKLNLGESTAIVIITTLFDNLFYVLSIPLLFLVLNINQLFPQNLHSFITPFWVGYTIIVGLTGLLFISIFSHPHLIEKLLLFICKVPFLSNYKPKVSQIGLDIVTASLTYKHKSTSFWLKILLSTTLSWVSRFLVVNSIILAFVSLSYYSNILIFGKQLVMWLVLLVSPTPGGSGVAEYLFSTFLGKFLPFGGLVIITSLLWRLISYYPYLFIGAFIIPKWFKKNN